MSFSVSYIYEIQDRYSKTLKRIQSNTDRFKKTVGSLQSAIGGLAAGAGIYSALKAYSKWEDSIADVNRVMNFSNKEMTDFQKTITKLSVQFAKPREGLAAIAYEGGKLGITKNKLEGFIVTVSKMAASFDMTDEAAGKSLGNIKTKLGLSMGQVINLTDSMNYLADTTSANGENMVRIIERLSGEFSTLGLSPKTAATWAAFADQLEVSPELAASGMGMMLRKLQAMPGISKSLFEKPNETIRMVLEKISKIDKVARQGVIKKLFGDEAGRFVKKAAMKVELFNKTLEKGLSKKAVGSMTREFENILSRTSTKVKRFGVIFKNTMASIGEKLVPVISAMQPYLIKFSTFVANFIKNHGGIVKITLAVAALAAAFTAIAIPISLALPVLTALGGLIAGLSVPALAFVGVIASIGGVFSYWYKSANPLIQSLKDLSAEFFVSTDSSSGFFSGIFKYFRPLEDLKLLLDGLGTTMAVLVNFLTFGVKSLKVFASSLGKLFTGDFSGAMSSFKTGMSKNFLEEMEKNKKMFGPKITQKIQAVSPTPTIKNNVLPISPNEAAVNKSVAINNNMKVGGNIQVQAEKGTKVTSANVNVNTGSNMANIRGL